MEYFKKMRDEIDVSRLLEEIDANDSLWLSNTSRQEKNKVQERTQSITLRGADQRPDIKVWENQESVNSPFFNQYPLLKNFLHQFASDMGGTLSRAKIVRLMPRHYVGVHTDKGSYYLIRDRYHLVLKSLAGSLLQSGNEFVTMREGELWWFDNKQHHSALNASDEWRVHVIFDVLPSRFAELAVNPVSLKSIVDSGILQACMPDVPIRPADLAAIEEMGVVEEH
ncbi:aspartyl/asparaginyl beta-hydroxylase domain-containing protein [Rhizobium rhizogenes]|uniref:aspartyl/asparaginyl beta-hydroxylase domain-containing protein n=1 Tax=Rhizobium rhizogenes TaxID=359 RepID=UPI00157302A7|nr:aspartyl/asparaginyl beta-hydroxylase domain-containing protein [Rhizobium rhizogenes]NTH23022.1 aspartyl/asparaginyl beta-hydroxylase domain-containing protein [Rhizobium rhizogenes]NTH36052.1 aspartyl/asparaginyl beta-hydroxylase domain-containing protein [Rhizobium rhizogenes]